MATPNNLTPTNCSWWPISALESDAAKPVEAPEAPEAASHAHWPKDSLVLYHWTQSFSSQKVRLVIAEKGLACEERDVSLPQSEHKEPWFMRLNLGEEVPVIIHRENIISDYDQIIDYVERTFTGEHVVALMPEAGSPQHARVLQYRELLDALPMDAYTHGCILHPELTTDSMIPKYATAEIRRHLANATMDLMKLDHEEEPQLSDPYLSKQKKLMAKILEHDDVSYLKKILGELAMVLDQIEAELEKRKLENEGFHRQHLLPLFLSRSPVAKCNRQFSASFSVTSRQHLKPAEHSVLGTPSYLGFWDTTLSWVVSHLTGYSFSRSFAGCFLLPNI
ncbi:ganglioside-induced differentiation-associated protein 1-like 1 isoform X4 [Balaenoptera musculus]|uniref:Ganglioside-induced differentiation-associated protein 1-like 1 isoform X4 n=1 Tax=Balaenoptera musculus TaxID=9771 RepID=A0A8B8V928_BALMU|nr:ganglioside-induced differentiation-associated protein 1-like 1 isoform X4 [Balaenoptera musculus]